MSFDLLDDIMISYDDLDRDMSFRDLIVPDENSREGRGGGATSEHSRTDLVQCITGDIDDGITDDERKELNDFLRDIDLSIETPRNSIVGVSGKRLDSTDVLLAINPLATDPCSLDFTSPQKRRRIVTPPTLQTPITNCNFPSVITPVSSPNSMPPPRPPMVQMKYTQRTKTRSTRSFVPFEEMQRLMHEYGPIKTQRKSKSSPDECGTASNAKIESVRRKFYRWFPDFEERFVKNSDGVTYRPKAGHKEEVQYRQTMRDMDQTILIRKRKIGRRC